MTVTGVSRNYTRMIVFGGSIWGYIKTFLGSNTPRLSPPCAKTEHPARMTLSRHAGIPVH